MIHHQHDGSGPPVLLIQGVGVAGCGWRPQVDGLADAFQLAWYDNPGIGDSPGPTGDLDAHVQAALWVMDTMGWQDAHIVGHSLGGVIATRLALEHADRVRSMTTMCSFARGAATLSFTPHSLWSQLRTVVGTRDQRRRAFFELVTDPARPIDEEGIRQLEKAFGRALCDLPPAATRQLGVLVRTDHRPRLAQLAAMPTLVVGATQDRIAPIEQSRILASGMDAALVELPGGHALPVQSAAEVNRALRGFWEQVEREM